MANKKKAKRTTKRERTVVIYETVKGTLKPFQIHGSWLIKRIELDDPNKDIGLKTRKSKFDIDFDGKTHVLLETANVRWNPAGSGRIDLTELPAGDIDLKQNIVLKAIIDLDGQNFELGLGSDDNGATLKVQLVPQTALKKQPGGTATGGRSS
jgi:hypothetical protein